MRNPLPTATARLAVLATGLLILGTGPLFAGPSSVAPNPATTADPVVLTVSLSGGCPSMVPPVIEGNRIIVGTSPGGCIGPPDHFHLDAPLGFLNPGSYTIDITAQGSDVVYETLNLEVVPTGDSCFDTPTRICLEEGRFVVEVRWRDFQNRTGDGHAAPLRSPDSGLFWFFDDDNWELLVKIVDGCVWNDRFWIFASATTNVEFTLEVTDTLSGVTRSYQNPLGTRHTAVTDTDAFTGCPGS